MASNRDIVDVSCWDGTLTPDDFAIAACSFADNWKTHNPSYPLWSWIIPKRRTLEEGYLSLEKICVFKSFGEGRCEEDHSIEDTADCSEKEELIDDAMLVQSQQHEAHYYDFHVIYSASYGVPVLYFRGYCSDGQPLPLDVIKNDFPACSANLLLESKWTFITQEEHPYLNRPWFKLHPCGTGEWMKLLFLGRSSAECQMRVELYLVSWFSVVGQMVGLKIPLEMMNDRPYGA